MCVIFIADRVRPTKEMVEKAFEKNKEGAGIAWREKGQVKWAKGLELDKISHLIQSVPLPFIAHFRIQTVGGVVPELTHPFQIDVMSSLALHGRTPGGLMFHNGTWHLWKDKLLDTAVKSGAKLPGGRWSDSRAMAFCAAIYGHGVLDMIDEKSVVMTPTDIEIYGNGWTRVNDVAVSNRLWEDVKYPTRASGEKSGTEPEAVKESENGKSGGASPQGTFRNDAEVVRHGENQPQGPQASAEAVRSGDGGAKESRTSERKISEICTVTNEKEAIDAIEWVRNLNPSEHRRSLRNPNSQEMGADTHERDRRAANARRGITHLGRI